MINLLKPRDAAPDTASLVIGSDLRAAGANALWRGLNLPGGNTQTRERVDKLFPESEVAASVLDVLASGTPAENVLVRMGSGHEGRFLCAHFSPLPSAAKPKKVLMQAWEMKTCFVLDGETGLPLEATSAADAVFGNPPRFDELLSNPETRAAALAGVARDGAKHLGRFKHRRPDGSEVELELALVLADAETN
jgi:hypothetical protein